MRALTHDNEMIITADREEILETLRRNRALHKEEYEEAVENYQIEMIEQLEKHVAGAKEAKERKELYRASVNLPVPMSFLDVYDTTITMLELHKEDTIPLTAEQVKSFVLNKWEWTAQFAGSTAMYLGKK